MRSILKACKTMALCGALALVMMASLSGSADATEYFCADSGHSCHVAVPGPGGDVLMHFKLIQIK